MWDSTVIHSKHTQHYETEGAKTLDLSSKFKCLIRDFLFYDKTKFM